MKTGIIIRPSAKWIIQVITVSILIVALLVLAPGIPIAGYELQDKTPWIAHSDDIYQNWNKDCEDPFTFRFDGKTLTGDGYIYDKPDEYGYFWRLDYKFTTESADEIGYTSFRGTASVHETGKRKVQQRIDGDYKMVDVVTDKTLPHTWQAIIDGDTLEVGVYGHWNLYFELPIKRGAAALDNALGGVVDYAGPFYVPKDKYDTKRAGDIKFQIMTTANIGIPGQLVFFYVKDGSALDSIVTTNEEISGSLKDGFTINDLWGSIQNEHNAKLVGYSYTDNNGIAVCNYLTNISGNIKNFVMKEGIIGGDIEVICVNPDIIPIDQNNFKYETWKISNNNKVSISHLGIAKLELVHWLGNDMEKEKKKKPWIVVERNGPNSSNPTKIKVDKDKKPFYLHPGDKILLEDNDWIKVVWLDGTRIKARPKSGKSGALTIVDGGTEWWIHIVETLKWPCVGGSISGAGALINIAGATATTTAGSVGAAFVGVVLAVPGMYVAYKDWKNPLLLELYSNVILDIDENAGEVNIFLVEGRCIIREDTEGDDATEMTTGQKVTIDKDRNTSIVSEFSISDLDEDMVSLLEEPTEISDADMGLVFESRSRPSGTEIQIPLTLNGIGEQVGNLDLTLTYDPSVLEAIDVIGGSLTLNSIMEYNITPGNIRIAIADGEGFPGDGSVVYVRFNVIGSEGQNTQLNITESIANDGNYNLIQLQNNSGTFSVKNADESPGDYDGDGQLSVVDALSALQMAVGNRPVDLSLDMNGDGEVTSLDARTILKIAVGID